LDGCWLAQAGIRLSASGIPGHSAPEVVMPIQFLCPEGHLLQVDESLIAQPCKCPYCETVFLVPQPTVDRKQPPGEPPSNHGATSDFGSPAESPVAEQQGPATDATQSPPAASPLTSQADEVVHVICPSGHELETPRALLGQAAMCPFCQAQFPLRFEDTVEFRRQRENDRERRERRAAKNWMQWSIVAAVVVVLGVVLLVVFASFR
jgi:hypothetical protein